MIFTPLPQSLPKLEALTRQMDAVAVPRPPVIETIGQRMRKAYAHAKSDGYRSLGLSDFRKLPYAYWLPPEPPLHEIHQTLVQRYWSEVLPAALGSGSRRAKRWFMPLFFTYCECFNPRDGGFMVFAEHLSQNIACADGEVAKRLCDLQREVAFFQPQNVAHQLAAALFNDAANLDQALEARLLWPKFVDTPLGEVVFTEILRFESEKFRDWTTIERVFDWISRLDAPISKTSHRVPFANALLLPWASHHAPDNVKAKFVEFFVKTYGDPRIPGHKYYAWHDVSPQAMKVIHNWLVGDTLRGFIEVLEKTADEIWKFRQKFWLAYYDAGYIQEAWLAFGGHALLIAQRLLPNAQGMGYGRLDSGAAQDQSVLLLKIGNIVFTEWSHNGSLRAYREDDSNVPLLYKASYHGSDLRGAASMDFHEGANMNPELRHMHSSTGSWQRKARDFIRRHTGIHLHDWNII